MTYRTLLVNVTPGRSNAMLLEVTAGLARTFDAGVQGIGACRPIECVCRDYPVPAALFDADRKQIARDIEEGERAFRAAMAMTRTDIDWKGRACTEPLAEHLASEASSADLIVVETRKDAAVLDATRSPDICDLVMQAGRPVLLVPPAARAAAFDRVLVAWKDTREARRALSDALPFLSKARQVTLVAIAPDEAAEARRSSLSDIVAWLARHGITAQAKVVTPSGAHAAQLKNIAGELAANLIVAGAYGYSRHGQWVLGGVTSELLGGDTCALVSH